MEEGEGRVGGSQRRRKGEEGERDAERERKGGREGGRDGGGEKVRRKGRGRGGVGKEERIFVKRADEISSSWDTKTLEEERGKKVLCVERSNCPEDSLR